MHQLRLMNVAVVIPTCERPDLLERCLGALLLQDLPRDTFEIIVVDDSMGGSAQLVVDVFRYESRPEEHRLIRYCRTTGRQGPAAARNRGWKLAQASIVAFTDDDTIPQMSWLRQGLAAFESDVVAAAGRVVVPLSPTPTDYERNEGQLATAEFVTANCFVRRTTLQHLGGFDEEFRSAWREDSDLHFRLLAYAAQQRMKGARADLAVVIHPVRPAPWVISLPQQRKSMFNALLYKKYPELYRRKIQSGAPWSYYSLVTSFLMAAVCSFASLWLVASTALALHGDEC